MSEVISTAETPRYACSTLPELSSWAIDGLDGVRGDGEADPDVAVAGAAGLDLRVDADHLAARVEQRAAAVAVVDRRIGLDHMVDRVAVRRLDRSLKGADDAGRHRALEAERVADRDDRIAHLDSTNLPERAG